MEVNFAPELERSLADLAELSGRAPNKLVEEVMAGYVAEMAGARTKLDSRYDDLASGKVKPVKGEDFFEWLRLREEELMNRSKK